MPLVETDIDIDFASRDRALQGLHHIPATVRDKHGRLGRHVSGVYFQPVPVNPLSGLCAYTYDEAAEHGYFKVDFLNNTIYQGVRDEAHLDALLAQEPEWELFDDPVFVAELPHIGNHYGTVQSVRPRSIDDLAIVLALIRPGKKHLIGKPRSQIDAQVWVPPTKTRRVRLRVNRQTVETTYAIQGGYHFKRAHAIAYAVSIVVKLNLLIETMSASLDQINDVIV